jgi:putative glycosyltransferase
MPSAATFNGATRALVRLDDSAGSAERRGCALSIVTTLYRSVPFLPEFHRRMTAEARKLTDDYEIVYVNDGSPDASLELALELAQTDPHVRTVDLSRNFGQHKAIMTGLEYAHGDRVFLLDVDLEEEPELLTLFDQTMRTEQADVVYGVQRERQGTWFKRWAGQAFYRLFEALSTYPVPSNPLNARLMTRRYVDSLLLHRERELYLAGLWAMTGYKQVPQSVIKHSRGSSSYTLTRRLTVTLNALLSFSNRPLIFIFVLGAVIMSLSGVAAATLIVRRLFDSEFLMGWASLIVSIWLLGGMTIFCLGIMSMYLSRIFIETKARPYSIVRQVYPPERAALGIDRTETDMRSQAA